MKTRSGLTRCSRMRTITLGALLGIALPTLAFSQASPSEPTPPSSASGPEPAVNNSLPSTREISTQPSTAGDEIVQMSPFRVDTSRENGYFSPNTLSGTRLNTRVQDLGASISIVTRQQLEDTASVDINDIFRYEANTEGIYNYTAQSSSSPTTDPIQQNPQLATRVRGISTPNITIDYFTHTTRIPFDTYNIDSAEISRGPNSTVAGLGSPAGTINTNLQIANLTRITASTAFRVDDQGGYRASINANYPILREKLAIRVAALYQKLQFPQKPSYDITRRLYATATYKPFANTTIRGKAEVYHATRQLPNSLTPRDGVTEWLQAGMPTWNPVTFTATVNGQQTQYPASADNAPPA